MINDLDTLVSRLRNQGHVDTDPSSQECKLMTIELEFSTSSSGLALCHRPGQQLPARTWCVRCNDTRHEIEYPIPTDQRGYPLPPTPCPGALRERGVHRYNQAHIPGRFTGEQEPALGVHWLPGQTSTWYVGPLSRVHRYLARLAGWATIEQRCRVTWLWLADTLQGWKPTVQSRIGSPEILIIDDIAAIMHAHIDRVSELCVALERFRCSPGRSLFVASELETIRGEYAVGRCVRIIREMCGEPRRKP